MIECILTRDLVCRKIQTAARSGKPITKPRWPVIIMRTPKVGIFSLGFLHSNTETDDTFSQGMTGPARVDNQTMVGSFHAHQVPLPRAKTDDEQLAALQTWLESYDINGLFIEHSGSTTPPDPADPSTLFTPEVLRILPPRIDRRLGMTKETYDGYEPLDLPEFQEFVDEKPLRVISPMKAIGGAFHVFRRLI